MTVPVPDRLLWRRVQTLEQQVERLSAELKRVSGSRSVMGLFCRLWIFTLTSGFTGIKADADLYDLDDADTGVNISVEDPLENFTPLGIRSGDRGVCGEQIDCKGKRHYIVVEWKCP